MIKFIDYLILLDPAYPIWCEVVSYPLCEDSKEYYEAYLRFKAEVQL